MADVKRRLPGNVAGEFYVDATCIDCDQCRRIAPATFRAQRDKSVVFRQPATQGEARRAEMALVTCPTGSIGTRAKRDLSDAIAAYPEPLGDGVYFCGFASEDTFGGSSYLIVRPEGNVLVDSPRFTAPLVERIEAMGGVRLMFLSHIDDGHQVLLYRDRVLFTGDHLAWSPDASNGSCLAMAILIGVPPMRCARISSAASAG